MKMIFFLLLSVPLAAQRDTIILKSGTIHVVKLISEDDKTIVFELEGKERRVPRDVVEKVISSEAPRQANLVQFISKDLADWDLFSLTVNALKTDGVGFENIDKDFFLCSTNPIKPRGIAMEYRFEISVTGNTLDIRSFVKSLDKFSSYVSGLKHETENTWERGANRSLSTSIWRYGWEKQLELADKILSLTPGGLKYTVE